jgi:hypothetical protein
LIDRVFSVGVQRFACPFALSLALGAEALCARVYLEACRSAARPHTRAAPIEGMALPNSA